jgi:hypothetical protein
VGFLACISLAEREKFWFRDAGSELGLELEWSGDMSKVCVLLQRTVAIRRIHDLATSCLKLSLPPRCQLHSLGSRAQYDFLGNDVLALKFVDDLKGVS